MGEWTQKTPGLNSWIRQVDSGRASLSNTKLLQVKNRMLLRVTSMKLLIVSVTTSMIPDRWQEWHGLMLLRVIVTNLPHLSKKTCSPQNQANETNHKKSLINSDVDLGLYSARRSCLSEIASSNVV